MPDPYEIIGVRRDASLDEIRIAYRRSAQVLHPDRFATSSDGVRSEAARRMLQLNGAMEAIELERTDEASGTGGLGSVSFGARSPGSATASPPASATRRSAAPAAPPPPPAAGGTNGTAASPATPRPPEPAPAAELPGPMVPGTSDEKPAAAEAAPAAAAPSTPPKAPGRELAAYVPPPVSEPEAAPEPEAPREPHRDAFAPTPRSAARPATPPRPAPEPEPEPEQRSYSLNADHAFSFDDDDTDYDDLPSVARRARQRGSRSIVPALIAGAVIVVALAVIAGYFLVGRGGGTGEQAFAKAGAPFTFRYPKDFRQRRLDGGVALNKPVFQVGFGLDADNYLLTSTYKLGFTVNDDGSATGPKGQQLTPDQIDHDIDVTIAKLAGQAGFTQKGVETGSLGSLRARIYDYAKSDGSLSSTFVVALSGKTEYYVTCQSSPRGEKRIAKACDRLLSSFAPA